MPKNEGQRRVKKSTAAKLRTIGFFATIGAISGFLLGDLTSGTALGAAGGILLSGKG